MKKLFQLFVIFLSSISFGQDSFDFTEYCYSNNRKIVEELNIDSLENVLLKKINDFRVSTGLKPLVREITLDQYAENWSYHMLKKEKIYHSDISDGGIVAENVFLTKSFGVFPMEKESLLKIADDIFKSWFNSEKHKSNMLNGDVKNVGLSIVLLPGGMIDQSAAIMVK
jgi:uncharacterized protein YkwD